MSRSPVYVYVPSTHKTPAKFCHIAIKSAKAFLFKESSLFNHFYELHWGSMSANWCGYYSSYHLISNYKNKHGEATLWFQLSLVRFPLLALCTFHQVQCAILLTQYAFTKPVVLFTESSKPSVLSTMSSALYTLSSVCFS